MIFIYMYTMKDKIPLFLFFFLQKSKHTINTVRTRTTNVITKTTTVDDTSFDCSSLEKSKSFNYGPYITLNIMQCCKSQSLTK